MFQIVLCLMCNLSWKFYEHSFIRFPVMLLTGTDFLEKKRYKKMHHGAIYFYISPFFYRRVWKTQLFSYFSLDLDRPSLKISCKSVHAFSRNVANDKQTNQPRWKHNLRCSAEVITQTHSTLIWQRTPYVSPWSLLGLTMRHGNIYI